MPGVRTLWRGWRDLLLAVEVYRLAASSGSSRASPAHPLA